MTRRRCLAGALLLAACGSRGDKAHEEPKQSVEPTAVIARRAAAIHGLRAAEYARAAPSSFADALSDHDPAVRRAAARALSRLQDGAALDLLGKGLSDEDGEVIAWSAYGLGMLCALGDTRTVRVLVARVTALEAVPEPPPPLSAHAAIFDALARCGSEGAEATLRAWLSGPPAARAPAALSLGRLAARRHRLDDASLVALLDAASASPPVHGALSAFAELESISDAAAKRLVQVAERPIHDGGPERAAAIAALLPAGAAGAPVLASVLSDAHASVAERSIAATTLGRIGKAAQPALHTAVAALVPADASLDPAWLETHFAPLEIAVSALDPPAQQSKDALESLAGLAVPGNATPFVVHRGVALRCAAAAVLAGSASQSAKLVHCDPDPKGRTGALAIVRVLDRGPLTRGRRRVWTEYATSSAPSVRRAALALLPRHLEAIPVVDELVQALGTAEPGVVAQAARSLADAPRLAGTSAAPPGPPQEGDANAPSTPEPSHAIVDALAHAMDEDRPPDQLETRVALAGAAAAVAALSLKPRLERYCKSDNVTLRRSAESALRSLGANTTACAPPKDGSPLPAVPPDRGPVALTFVTDAGRLGVTLDPTYAPLSVARVVELAKMKFYDGVTILRVAPGYLVQLGDPAGDGSGGSGERPLPSEGAPVELGAFSVGLALGGQDTGSSQFFVTEADEPELFGDYPFLGSADPDWAKLAAGDCVVRVEVH